MVWFVPRLFLSRINYVTSKNLNLNVVFILALSNSSPLTMFTYLEYLVCMSWTKAKLWMKNCCLWESFYCWDRKIAVNFWVRCWWRIFQSLVFACVSNNYSCHVFTLLRPTHYCCVTPRVFWIWPRFGFPVTQTEAPAPTEPEPRPDLVTIRHGLVLGVPFVFGSHPHHTVFCDKRHH